MCYVFQSPKRSNQYVGVWSALVEVSRLVINWPSQTAARYQTKKVIDNKHLILLRKLKVFRTAITLQDTAFGSVCQVHPLTSTLAYTVHCLKFQDLSLIGPARVIKQHNRQSLRKSWITNISYCIKKNWWFVERLSLYKTLFLALFLGLLIFLIWQVVIERFPFYWCNILKLI